MSVRVVRLGSDRLPGEGIRIGTVRRPPRGVRKDRYADENWYDVWLPMLAPSADLVKRALAAESEAEWSTFARRCRAEMKEPEADRALRLLSAFSHVADFSVGCYCETEERCHRSILRELLAEHGAEVG